MDTDSLTIKDVTDVDEGTYTCIMNTTLDQDSASAMLTVVGMFTQCALEGVCEFSLYLYYPLFQNNGVKHDKLPDCTDI